MTFELALSITTFISMYSLGINAFLRNKKSDTNILFCLLSILISIYIFVNYVSLHPPSRDLNVQLFWIRFVMFITSFIGPTLLILAYTFPKDKITLKGVKLYFLLGYMLLVASLAFTPLIFSKLETANNPTPGPLIPLFFIDFLGLFIVSFIVLLVKYFKSSGREKAQIFYFLLGTIITFLGMAITTVVFVVILKRSDLVYLGPNFSIFLVIFTAYAILKHRLFGIGHIIGRFLYVLILSSIIIITVYIAHGIADKYFISIYTLGGFTVIAGFFGIFTILVQRFQRKITAIVDKYFIYEGVPYDTASEKLIRAFSTQLESEKIIHTFMNTFNQTVLSENNFIYTQKYGYIPENNIIIKQLKNEEELLKIISDQKIKNSFFTDNADKDIRTFLHKESVRIAPIWIGNEVYGYLSIGERLNGTALTQNDIYFIDSLILLIQSALTRSLLFEKVQGFNKELEYEVEKATSDLKIYQKNLEEAYKGLQQLDKAKDEFVSIVSHELRTPLTAIKSYTWLALNENPSKEKLDEYLNTIYNAASRLIRLVNNILTTSRIDTGKLTLIAKPTNIHELITSCLREMDIKAKEKSINLTSDIRVDGMYILDDEKMKEVIINLISNAIKFTPEGGTIHTQVNAENNYLLFILKDNGIGIKDEDKEKLFKKFSRLDITQSGLGAVPGSGLGLYISKVFIELHGGTIKFESEYGKGTVFTIAIPSKRE